MTTGQTELLEDGHHRRRRRGRTTLLGLRMEQRADEAGAMPLQADCTTMRPLGSWPKQQSDALESELILGIRASLNEADASKGMSVRV